MSNESTGTFQEMLDDEQYSPDVQAIAWELRSLIYEVLPQTVEVIWKQQRIAGYGTGPKKMSEQFAYIAPMKKHVNLGFYYGSELPDPDNLLEGTGALMRHVKIKSLEQARTPAVRALLEFAKGHRVPPPKSG